MTSQLSLHNRRSHITQKVWIVGQRTLYLNVYKAAPCADSSSA